MADRWNPQNHASGTYVWLPAVESADGSRIAVLWREDWRIGDSIGAPAPGANPNCIPRDMWHVSGAVLSQ
eukprot:2689908-Amphidinium_carterae.1